MTHEPLRTIDPADPAGRSAPAADTEDPAAGPATRSGAAAPPTRLTEIGARRFLDELAEIGSVVEAAHRSRTPRASLYRRRARDPDFAAAWNEALQLAVDRLQDETMMRAIEGVEQPVFYRGEQVASVRRVSDRLLMFLLRAHRRELYDPAYIKPWVPADKDETADDEGGSFEALLREIEAQGHAAPR